MNVVLIIILIAVVVLAAVSGAKHFKGQGGCCGGGGELRPEHKKLDGPVTEEKIISIDGMSCENCRNRVERAINKNRRSFGESKSSQKRSDCFARQRN